MKFIATLRTLVVLLSVALTGCIFTPENPIPNEARRPYFGQSFQRVLDTGTTVFKWQAVGKYYLATDSQNPTYVAPYDQLFPAEWLGKKSYLAKSTLVVAEQSDDKNSGRRFYTVYFLAPATSDSSGSESKYRVVNFESELLVNVVVRFRCQDSPDTFACVTSNFTAGSANFVGASLQPQMQRAQFLDYAGAGSDPLKVPSLWSPGAGDLRNFVMFAGEQALCELGPSRPQRFCKANTEVTLKRLNK